MWLDTFFKKKVSATTEDNTLNFINESFDPKYKIILCKGIDSQYVEMINWVDRNSKNSVDVKVFNAKPHGDKWVETQPSQDNNMVFLGFENEDDAIYFKIKYSL